MNYAESVAHLYSLEPELPSTGKHSAEPSQDSAPASAPRRKFDLAYMRALCAYLGDPQKRFPSILIAGTNGKGSTAATLASILTAAGYRTGLYTSPHLVEPSERIQTARPLLPSEYGVVSEHGSDGPLKLAPLSDGEFAELYTRVDDACTALVNQGTLPIAPSFFERLTALAFLAYAGRDETGGVEVAVLEVGLGGRLDATNVVDPVLTVLTDIALDHQEYLGSTIREIAREKCGILRAGIPLVTLPQHPEANQVIGEVAAELRVPGVSAADYLPPAVRNNSEPAKLEDGACLPRNRYLLSLEDAIEPGQIEVDSPLPGVHQQRNLALAIACAVTLRSRNRDESKFEIQSGYKSGGIARLTISNTAISQGIAATHWPGRLEWMEPNLLLDVAHNPAGAWTLRSAIASLPVSMPRTLIFSCLRDKDLEEMSRILFPLFDAAETGDQHRSRDHIIVAPILSPRASSLEQLLVAARDLGVRAHAAPHLEAALSQARRITPPGGIIVATGSVYLVGALRELATMHSAGASR